MKTITLTEFTESEFRNLLTETVTNVVQSELAKLQINSPEQKQFLDRKEAGALLGISLVTLDSYVKQGFLKAYRVGYKKRFKYSEVLEALTRINVGV